MEIYLDANATTPVLPEARLAALSAMEDDFGNPSSTHGSGLKARALIDGVRAKARRVLGAPTGQLLFMSGATEGIQTAVLSALNALRQRREQGDGRAELLLYGATEHKAVPEALRHWNALLRLDLPILAIPVGTDGRHDLTWLQRHAPRAGLVCTMAANNETGVVSDLDGIQHALAGSPALWLVDSVQALGKLALDLSARPIDYAPFSGHKLYAPKGIGLLYVRDGAPLTPLITGGGQEGAKRSGTENMPGIAALGAVFTALEAGRFQPPDVMQAYRTRVCAALQEAFPGVVFNADPATSLPTTINFSVPGLSSKLLLDLFDAAAIRVSGGSACGAAKSQPSDVLRAMGLAPWRCASAVRLSFGPATTADLVDETCRRLRDCGAALRESCLTPSMTRDHRTPAAPAPRLTRHVVDGACCYVVADAATRRCVVIDPPPELTESLAQWLRCQGYAPAAVLDTHSHGDHASAAAALWAALPPALADAPPADALGWPLGADTIQLGTQRLTRLPTPGHTSDAVTYLWRDATGLVAAFVGDTVMPGALGRSDFPVSQPLAFGPTLRALDAAVGRHALLLPGHDYDERHACTLGTEIARQPLLASLLLDGLDDVSFARAKAALEQDLPPTEYQTMACGARVDSCSNAARVVLSLDDTLALPQPGRRLLAVDVREAYEQRLGSRPDLGPGWHHEAVPLSTLVNALPGWLSGGADITLLVYCRSGNRSAKAAQALRRLGLQQAWSLDGGVALCHGIREAVAA
ncbi:aminotransferase class V-fold PLP-dependent enzyme [Roseateles sp. BYS78W]|uniref:cysteine desulfurase n=1 Tax=Pelomonas candidula TaxID=3299025 RepID=A0ABW7HAJ0_9BURK